MVRGQYVVKWVIPGQMIICGMSHQRFPGDEDIVTYNEMTSMVSCGQAEKVGLVGEVMPKRILKGNKK